MLVCQKVDTVRLNVDRCESVIRLPMVSNISGVVSMVYAFNGAVFSHDITVNVDEQVTIPNKFSEGYIYTVKMKIGDNLLSPVYKIKIS